MPSAKRTSSGSAGGAAKVPRTARMAKGLYAQVVKGLAASDLPQIARDMLADMAVVCLEIEKEKRDKYQSKIAEMTEEVLSSVEVTMQKKVDELGHLLSEDVKAREHLEHKSAAKGDEIEAKSGEVLAKKRQLAELARSFKVARVAAQDAEVKTTSIEAEANVKAQERGVLMGLRTSLDEPTPEGDVLAQKFKNIGIIDSMMVALPAVLAKEASARGSFDAMVVTSVRDELSSRIAAADQVIQNVEPAKAAATEALRKAEAALKEANVQQVGGAAAYEKVHGEEEELGKEAEELKVAMRKVKDAARKHNGMSSKAKQNLEAFRQGAKQAFQELRDKEVECAAAGVPKAAEGAGDDAAPEEAEAAPEKA